MNAFTAMKNNVQTILVKGSTRRPQVAIVTPTKGGSKYHHSTVPNNRDCARTAFNSACRDSTTVAPGGAGGVVRRVWISFQAMKIAPPMTIKSPTRDTGVRYTVK